MRSPAQNDCSKFMFDSFKYTKALSKAIPATKCLDITKKCTDNTRHLSFGTISTAKYFHAWSNLTVIR